MENEQGSGEEQMLSDEEWQAQYKEVYQLNRDLFDELKRIHGAGEYFSQYGVAMKPLFRKLRDASMSEEEMDSYVAWHIIKGGGTSREYSPHVDFSGDISVKKFLEEKLAELKTA